MISFNLSLLNALLGLLVLVVADWIFGILSAFRTGTFTWTYVSHQGEAQALAFGFALALWALDSVDVGSAAVGGAAVTGLFLAYSAAYSLTLVADIVAKVGVVANPVAAASPAHPAA